MYYIQVRILLFSLILFLASSCKKDNTVIPTEKSPVTITPIDTSQINTLPQPKKITVVIEGIKQIKGIMALALYNRAEDFNNPSAVFLEAFVPVTGKDFSYTFNNIDPGTYALAVFHDENENDELDTNIFKIPKEGFGFSNNAFGNFSPPTFDQAKFILTEDLVEVNLNITLKFY